ncbi:hypothetical protein [Deferrisoma camini]|uniref:hypothetical protein n=1 Tax=Deferrisoma camini TaxID=1035120 RepID=UPI00046D29A1|nr:hypothetical protein [Deferrisoma camini]
MSRPVRVGQVYRCPVCRAEVVVINAASAALEPHCCNQPMEAVRVVPVYRCPVCGSEVAVLRQDDEAPELICCGRPMEPREAREAA